MARPRAFKKEVALEKAMQIFWQQGCDATSMEDLERALGLSRSSIYLAFGSKQALMLACLDRYIGQVGDALSGCAAQRMPAALLLDRLFETILKLTTAGGRNRGCFLGNTALERGGRDAEARRRVRKGLRGVASVFAEVVRRGIADGELPATLEPVQAGQFLTSSIQGMLVMAKAGATGAELGSLRKSTLSTLTQEQAP